MASRNKRSGLAANRHPTRETQVLVHMPRADLTEAAGAFRCHRLGGGPCGTLRCACFRKGVAATFPRHAYGSYPYAKKNPGREAGAPNVLTPKVRPEAPAGGLQQSLHDSWQTWGGFKIRRCGSPDRVYQVVKRAPPNLSRSSQLCVGGS